MVTTILWFLVGVMIILGVARYNESEKLFWQLLISFVGTYGAATLAINALSSNEKKQSKEVVIASKPMQVPSSKSYTICSLADLSGLVTVEEKSSVPVGKDTASKLTNPSLSGVGRGARDQPMDTIMYDTS